MKKNKLYGVAVLAIVMVVFNIIAFLLPETRGGTFWSGYAFTMAALLLQLLFFYLAFGKADNLKKTFLGLSIAQIGVTYLILQSIWGIVCLFVPTITPKFAVVVSVMLLGFYLISVILAMLGRDTVQKIDDKIKAKSLFIKSLIVDMEVLTAQTDNSKIKPILEKLLETVKYSDPMSHEGLTEVEEKITNKYSELEVATKNTETTAVQAVCKDMDALFAERNKKCKLLK